MALSIPILGLGLTLLSCCLTATVIGNAYYQKKQFYPSVVYITKSNPSMAAIYLMAFTMVIMFGKFLKKIFFGTLRAAEYEHLIERFFYAVTETCLAFTVFRDDFSPKFVALFTVLLFLKAFHWLADYRVDYMERSPVITRLFHIRVASLLVLLSTIDILLVRHAYHSTMSLGASVQLVFGFEYAILLTVAYNIGVKYVCHGIDLQSENPWENKAMYLLYTELFVGFIKVLLYVAFLLIMVRIHTFPLFIIRPMYLTMKSFKKALQDMLQSRRAIHNMNTLYPNATAEDLQDADNVCIICREEMIVNTGVKKLPCNHLFHSLCLRSWFQRQQTCPTCRLDVLRQLPPPLRHTPHLPPNPLQQQQGAQPPPLQPARRPPTNIMEFLQQLMEQQQERAGQRNNNNQQQQQQQQVPQATPPAAPAAAAAAGAAAPPAGAFGGFMPPFPPFPIIPPQLLQQIQQQQQLQQQQLLQQQQATQAGGSGTESSSTTTTTTTSTTTATTAPAATTSAAAAPTPAAAATIAGAATPTAVPVPEAAGAVPPMFGAAPGPVPFPMPPFPGMGAAGFPPMGGAPFPPMGLGGAAAAFPPGMAGLPPMPPPPPRYSGLTTSELQLMEGRSRSNIVARLEALDNINTLVHAAMVQLSQYNQLVARLDLESPLPAADATTSAAAAAASTASSNGSATAAAASSNGSATTSAAAAAGPTSNGSVTTPTAKPASSGSPAAAAAASPGAPAATDESGTAEEVRRRRLERFAAEDTAH